MMPLIDLPYLLFSLRGRLSRQSYILGWVVLLLASFLLIWLPNQIPLLNIQGLPAKLLVMCVTSVNLVATLIVLFGMVGIHVKRFHDLNLSGWFTIFFFTPLNPLVLIICALLAGKTGPNRFGI